MADNTLKAIIDVSAPGAVATFKDVANNAKSTDSAFKSLEPSVSKLGSTLNALKFNLLDLKADLLNTTDVAKVKLLNSQIAEVENEIKRVGTIGENGFGKIGAGATHALTSVRQLAYILPGIGVAGLFDLAFKGLQAVGEKIFDISKSFNEAAVNAEVLKNANKSVGDDVARLQALVSVARDVSLTTKERSNAIGELQRLYPDYLRNISLENINSQETANAIRDLTRSIVAKAVAQEYSKKVAEETFKLAEKRDALEESISKRNDKAAEKDKQNFKGLNNDGILRLAQLSELDAEVKSNTEAYQQQQVVVDKLTDKLKQSTIAELDFVKTPREKVAKDWDEIGGIMKAATDRAKELRKEFEFLTDEAKNLRVKATADISFDAIANNLPDEPVKKISSNIQQLVKNLTESNPILIRAHTKIELTVDQKDLAKQMDDINAAIASGFQNIFESIGKGLADADLGKSITTAIGDMLENIGKALIKFAIIKLVLDKILKDPIKVPGVVALALGITAIAFGELLKNIKGFAGGGPVMPGIPILVGESGREVFVPNTGGRIVPNNQLGTSAGGLGNGGNTQHTVIFEIHGRQLRGILTLTDQSLLRLT